MKIDEISNGLKGKYIKKAAANIATKAMDIDKYHDINSKNGSKQLNKLNKRKDILNKTVDQLTEWRKTGKHPVKPKSPELPAIDTQISPLGPQIRPYKLQTVKGPGKRMYFRKQYHRSANESIVSTFKGKSGAEFHLHDNGSWHSIGEVNRNKSDKDKRIYSDVKVGKKDYINKKWDYLKKLHNNKTGVRISIQNEGYHDEHEKVARAKRRTTSMKVGRTVGAIGGLAATGVVSPLAPIAAAGGAAAGALAGHLHAKAADAKDLVKHNVRTAKAHVKRKVSNVIKSVTNISPHIQKIKKHIRNNIKNRVNGARQLATGRRLTNEEYTNIINDVFCEVRKDYGFDSDFLIQEEITQEYLDYVNSKKL